MKVRGCQVWTVGKMRKNFPTVALQPLLCKVNQIGFDVMDDFMGHMMCHRDSADCAVMVLITLSLLLCSGTSLDSSRISGSSNGSDPFVLASKSLDNETNVKELENDPYSKVNKTSLEDEDMCSSIFNT
ncbi:hypothetical protein PoB_005965000 [Plakobranchus ocellatus]|uniref:Uncharacterized protein n=1 Tax=Plakobranchus ocellatus TaxID=259542 RepID=A0AAV4CJS8_9GAST|nr:hypothetical protein PoB_005965000 [Plakobranchus ocellatus]